MKKIPYRTVFIASLGCSLLVSAGLVLAAEKAPTLEQRLERLERILQNQSLTDVVMQLQRLQQEVQQLRGELELQSHTLDALNKRQRDLYLDIDQRLSNMQAGAGAASSLEVPSAAAAPPEVAPVDTPIEQPPMERPVAEPSQEERPVNLTPPDPKQEAEAYQAAFNLLQKGRYQESIQAFQEFLRQFSGGSYEDNAQYWLGEANYVSQDYDNALSEFTKVVERYPTSSKVAGALLKSGYIHYEKKDWPQAREFFERVKQEYAGSTEARLADKRLERMVKEGH